MNETNEQMKIRLQNEITEIDLLLKHAPSDNFVIVASPSGVGSNWIWGQDAAGNQRFGILPDMIKQAAIFPSQRLADRVREFASGHVATIGYYLQQRKIAALTKLRKLA